MYIIIHFCQSLISTKSLLRRGFISFALNTFSTPFSNNYNLLLPTALQASKYWSIYCGISHSPDYFLLSFSLFTKHFAACPNDNKFVSFHGSLPTLSPFLKRKLPFSVVCETLCKKEAYNIMCRVLCIFVQK